jgi:hypothetical protein
MSAMPKWRRELHFQSALNVRPGAVSLLWAAQSRAVFGRGNLNRENRSSACELGITSRQPGRVSVLPAVKELLR